MSVITCPSCNTPAPPGAIFCDNCGYDLRAVAPSSQQPAVPPNLKPPVVGNEVICPTCGHNNIGGSAFCENCGSSLVHVAPPAQPPVAAPSYPPMGQPAAVSPVSVTGRLIVQETKTTLSLPTGKQAIVLGREDPVSGIFPDIDLDPHGGHEAGVGRKHAQLIIQGGQVFIEDLESVNGTVVNKQRLAPRQPHPLKDGDELRLGKLVMVYYTH